MKYFGTDGFRGEANVGLTVEHAYKIGRFVGWYYGANRSAKARVIVGKDTRRSSYMFEAALVSGLVASGADAYILHVIPTPGVAHQTVEGCFDCGIMISASHNPFCDNGIKLVNSDGFKSLGPKSLVIACSHSGNTQEVVDGCEMALAAGAEVVAMTDCEGSKIDNGKWTTWVYPWGEGVSQAEVPQGIGALIAAELLDQQEGYEALADMYEGLKQMDALLPAAREKVNAELGARFAELCQQHKFFYILGSGPNFSQTYAMAICSLMEMQWQHCCYIHSGEYFHGPFEATEPGVFYFVQLGAGECRPMEERALAFLNTHTDTIMVLDALEYGVGDVPASVRSYLEPIFFYNMSCELRAARGKVFDHSPEVRRYMGIEQY